MRAQQLVCASTAAYRKGGYSYSISDQVASGPLFRTDCWVLLVSGVRGESPILYRMFVL